MSRAVANYRPQGKTLKILEYAKAYIKAVPYKVTARWLFYRLLQDGLYRDKKDYRRKFIQLLGKVRKSFFDGWRPDTLADDTREVIPQGGGYWDPNQWLEDIRNSRYDETVWLTQRNYIEVWFEAKAMVSQFRHYIKDIPLFPFGGDCSIAPKWEAAKRLERAYNNEKKPIVILYFGDDDTKGNEIPENAVVDIRAWCSAPFEFIRVGLNPGDGVRLGLPENIDKPGAYQWEALSDEQAKDIILTAVNKHFDQSAADDAEVRSDRITENFQEKLEEFFDNLEDEEGGKS